MKKLILTFIALVTVLAVTPAAKADGFQFWVPTDSFLTGAFTYSVTGNTINAMTLGGLPVSFQKFGWPFHASSSGADTFLVHGEVKLEDGENSPLHAKVAASPEPLAALPVCANCCARRSSSVERSASRLPESGARSRNSSTALVASMRVR